MNVTEIKYAQYAIGKGKLYVNARYLGNTPEAALVNDPNEGLQIHFTCDDISLENVILFAKGISGLTGTMRFEATGPTGPRIDYDFPCVTIHAVEMPLKGDEWQTMSFVGTVKKKDGVLYRFTYPQTYEVG